MLHFNVMLQKQSRILGVLTLFLRFFVRHWWLSLILKMLVFCHVHWMDEILACLSPCETASIPDGIKVTCQQWWWPRQWKREQTGESSECLPSSMQIHQVMHWHMPAFSQAVFDTKLLCGVKHSMSCSITCSSIFPPHCFWEWWEQTTHQQSSLMENQQQEMCQQLRDKLSKGTIVHHHWWDNATESGWNSRFTPWVWVGKREKKKEEKRCCARPTIQESRKSESAFSVCTLGWWFEALDACLIKIYFQILFHVVFDLSFILISDFWVCNPFPELLMVRQLAR